MDPRFLFMWPNARIAMEPMEQLVEKAIQVENSSFFLRMPSNENVCLES